MENNTSQKNQQQDAYLERKMASGSFTGMVTTGFHLVSRLLLVPIILHFVPLSHYGLWSVCFIILSYAGMSAFGVQNAYIKYTAEYHALGDVEAINVLVSTGLTVVGLVCAAIFIAIALGAPLIMGLFEIDPGLKDLAQFMILGTTGAFLVELWLGAFKGVLEGLQEIALTRMIWLSSTLVEVVLVLVFLFLGYGIKGVMYAYVLKTVFEMLINVIMAFKKLNNFRIKPMIRRETFGALFVFGGKVQVLGILGIFIGTFDRIVVTAMLGLDATGLFEVGRKLPFTGRNITSAALAPFLPAASSLDHYWQESHWLTTHEKFYKYTGLCLLSVVFSMAAACPFLAVFWKQNGFAVADPYLWGMVFCGLSLLYPGIPLMAWFNRFMGKGESLVADRLKTIYLNGCRHINIINTIFYVYILAAAPQLLLAWVGPGYNKAVPITVLIALTTFIHLGTGVGTAIFKGLNRTGRELEYALVQMILALIWVPGLAYTSGLLGAVAGTAMSTTVASLYFIWRSNIAFHVSFMDYMKHTLLPGIAPVFAGCMVFMALRNLPSFSRWWTVVEILVSGVGYLVLTGIILKHWFLTQDELQAILKPLARFKRHSLV